MRINFESVFNACIKISAKCMSLSNALITIAAINTLLNTVFLMLGHIDYIEYQSLSNRLILVSFACIGIALLLALVSWYALRKLESE